MSRIQSLFDRKKSGILNVFYTAGFPQRDSTLLIARELEAAGVDLIEIGIPFSDPIADGPVIQESNKVALANGMSVKLLLEQVKEIRRSVKIPIILMGYLNPVMQYGIERFCQDAAESGVDGLILPDMPMDEYLTTYKPVFEAHGLSNTFLISPTTSEKRVREIDMASAGFIYAVSSSSTTGARKDFGDDQIAYFKKLKALKLKNPFLIGFGISNHATFSRAGEFASGAIIGSAFITLLKNSADLKHDIRGFIHSLTTR
jgi:tryptophan synthase alpha chain